jgi:hypothetical protein
MFLNFALICDGAPRHAALLRTVQIFSGRERRRSLGANAVHGGDHFDCRARGFGAAIDCVLKAARPRLIFVVKT